MDNLFIIFIQVGLFTVGGGLAAVPILQEFVERENWMSYHEFISIIAVSESTPGSIGVNMATFVGNQQFGIWGGVVATFALVLPSIIIITTIARFLPNFSEIVGVKRAFYGVRPAVVGLIATAAYALSITAVTTGNEQIDLRALLLFFVALGVALKLNPHPIFLIVVGGVIGWLFF